MLAKITLTALVSMSICLGKISCVDKIELEDYSKIEYSKPLKKDKLYFKGYTTTSVNIRKGPGTDYEILDTYKVNKKIEYVYHNDDWYEIKFRGKTAYICRKYISKNKQKIKKYKEYNVPYNKGFKSYMDYRCITSTGSKQYKLQYHSAYTGNYGIRQINGRYCVAIGSYFTTDIGKYFDLVLENGTVIPCILADAKADRDTDKNNIVTEHNGCVSEFIVDTGSLYRKAKQMGDISYCNESWKSPVKKIRVYN